jgi:hypothetical protein
LFGFEKARPSVRDTPGASCDAASPEIEKALPLLTTPNWTLAYPYWVLPVASWPEPTMYRVHEPVDAEGEAVS